MIRYIVLSMVLFFSISLTGCTDAKFKENVVKKDEKATETDLSSQNTFEFSYNGQNFEIIYFYEEILDYIENMKGNILEKDQEAIFQENVLKPFNEKTSLDITSEDTQFLKPSWRIEELEENTKALMNNEKQINRLIEEAAVKSAELLPGEDTAIYIFPANPEKDLRDINGIEAEIISENGFILNIDPSFSEDALKSTVAHEYHHLIKFLYNGDHIINKLLDMVIIEGEAVAFSKLVYPEIKINWAESLSDNEESIILEVLRKNMYSTSWDDYDKLVNGNAVLGLPQMANYKIGYKIVDSYLENNPEVSIDEWIKLNTEEIVKGSQYRDLLE